METKQERHPWRSHARKVAGDKTDCGSMTKLKTRAIR